jgi:basic amino acid/polyamine antiporter, APA family
MRARWHAAPPYHAAMTGSDVRATPSAPGFVRAIGRWDLTALVVNGVIGSSIFGLPATLALLTGQWSPLAMVVAAAGIALIVLCFAEVASRFRDHGGVYLYARVAFGPLVGFEVGWLLAWTRILSAAANLNLFVLYLAELWPEASAGAPRALVMCALGAVVAVTNIVGVRSAAWSVNAFTIAKLAPLALLVVLGLPQVDGDILASQAVAEPDWTQAVLILMFAFGGFESALMPAAEMRDPKRDVAFALLVGLAAIAAVYVLVQLVVVGTVANAGAEKAPIAAALGVLLGPSGAVLASLAAMVSVYGWTTGATLAQPRVIHAMAERGELPRALAHVHPSFRTPVPAIALFVALSLALALAGSFAANATFAAIVRLVYYGLTCAALVVLRRRSSEPPGFALPAGPFVAALAIAFCAWLLSTRSFDQLWILLALIAAGLPFYLFGRWRASRPTG